MRLCILDNDVLDPQALPTWGSYPAMFKRLLQDAGFAGDVDVFKACQREYPPSFDGYDAVLLTGSRHDAFSDEGWVVELRARVSVLLNSSVKLLGICFGHQLIAHCLGAKVARAPQGWGLGRQIYRWHQDPYGEIGADHVALLASHQDQVLELPAGATLLASQDNCPIAAYSIGHQVLCIQPHPEFDAEYMGFLLNKRRRVIDEAVYEERLNHLRKAHDGLRIGRLMVRFLEDPGT